MYDKEVYRFMCMLKVLVLRIFFQKFGFGKIFNVFERKLFCSPSLHLIKHTEQKKKNTNDIKYYYNLK